MNTASKQAQQIADWIDANQGLMADASIARQLGEARWIGTAEVYPSVAAFPLADNDETSYY